MIGIQGYELDRFLYRVQVRVRVLRKFIKFFRVWKIK